MTQLIRNRRID